RPDPSASPGVLIGAFAGLTSAALFSVFSLASQGLMRQLGPLNLSILQYIMATLLLAPFLPFLKPVEGQSAWLAIAALGVVGTALSFQLYLFALTRLPAVVCGGFVCLEPVYAIVLAALIFHEPIGVMVAVSAVIIVGSSMALLRWSRAAAPDALTGAQP
ncbi:MAG: DMT family transporter, partial [Alphaproteobacteria bacterium]